MSEVEIDPFEELDVERDDEVRALVQYISARARFEIERAAFDARVRLAERATDALARAIDDCIVAHVQVEEAERCIAIALVPISELASKAKRGLARLIAEADAKDTIAAHIALRKQERAA